MAVLRESPWYQEIEQKGRELGLQQGLQEGARRQLMRALQLRFGEVTPAVQAQLESKNLEQLETLMDAAIAVSSLDEFVKILSI